MIDTIDKAAQGVAELVSKTSKIGSHIERVASAAGECGLAARQSAHPASTLPGGRRLDDEVAHGLSQAYTVKRATA